MVGAKEIGREMNETSWASVGDGEGGEERQRCHHGGGHASTLWIKPYGVQR